MLFGWKEEMTRRSKTLDPTPPVGPLEKNGTAGSKRTGSSVLQASRAAERDESATLEVSHYPEGVLVPPEGALPLATAAGSFADDEDWDLFQEAIRDYRRKLDRDLR
jgi:hypothetical protein